MNYTEIEKFGLFWHILDNDDRVIYDASPGGCKRYKIIEKPGSVKLFVIDKIVLEDHECETVDDAQRLAARLASPLNATTKKCSRCSVAKPVEDFYVSKNRPMSVCKNCNRIECFKVKIRRIIRTQGAEGAKAVREKINTHLQLNAIMDAILLEFGYKTS